MPDDVLDRLLRPLRRPPVTGRYPDRPPEVAAATRGLPVLDPTRCDGDTACVGACPTRAIRYAERTWTLDLGACIFCAACERACPRGAIELVPTIELATRERNALVVVRTTGSRS